MVNEKELFYSKKITDAGTHTTQKDSGILKGRSPEITLAYKAFWKMLGSDPKNFRQVRDDLTVDDDTFRAEKIPKIIDTAGKVFCKTKNGIPCFRFVIRIGGNQIIHGKGKIRIF